MRHVEIDGRGRQPIVIIEGMPQSASLHYLGRSGDLLYLVERDAEEFRLHIGDHMLTPSHIHRALSVDIGAHVLGFSHTRAQGELFFDDAGTRGFMYHTDLQGRVLRQENLVLVLSYRPRDVPFADIRYNGSSNSQVNRHKPFI